MKKYCLTLDLKNDPALIEEYKRYHRDVWPEIKESITSSGILSMEIYNIHNRLFMIMETTDDFTFDKKAKLDAANPKVREWEELMLNFQQPLTGSTQDEKWMLMERIFDLQQK